MGIANDAYRVVGGQLGEADVRAVKVGLDGLLVGFGLKLKKIVTPALGGPLLASRIKRGEIAQAARELRVVLYHGIHTHHDGRVTIAVFVNPATRLLRCDPFRSASSRRDLAIEGHRVLKHDIGHLRLDEMEERLVDVDTFIDANTLDNFNTRSAKLRDAAAGHQGVGIRGAHNHTGDACIDQSLSARWLLAFMAAGLKRHVDA